MVYGLLFKKTSTCYKNPDIEYLDETSDYKLRIMLKQGKINEEEFRAKHTELERNISYLTKENHGRVYAGGFLRDMLLEKKGIAPEKLDNQTRKDAITAAVFKTSRKHGAYRGALGHKMVFSVSEDLCKKIENSGLNLDEMLGREVKKIMYEFQKKFHNGEKIGFAWGIHHDTDNRHVHIYLCNRTNLGNHVALSNPLKGRRDRRKRKDQIGYMKERCVAAQQRMLRECEAGNEETQVLVTGVELSPELIKRQKNVEEMEEVLRSKVNLLNRTQLEIRELSADYFKRKDLISEGWNGVRVLNGYISGKYRDLKEKSIGSYSSNTFNPLGYTPYSSTLKFFSRIIRIMNNEADRLKREQILNEINQSKEIKKSIIDQLRIIDEEKRKFHQVFNQMKRERNLLREEVKAARKRIEEQKIRYNLALFKEFNKDLEKEKLYMETGRSLWRKLNSGEDYSSEKALINELDREIREKVSKQKVDEKEDLTSKGLKFNFQFFLNLINDQSKRELYQKTGQALWQKKRSNEDYSGELKILKGLDEEAREAAVKKFFFLEERSYLDREIETLKFNFDFFIAFEKDEDKRREYLEVSNKVLEKMKRHEDFSEELKVLKSYNNQAIEIALKLFPGLAAFRRKPDDPGEDQGRGIKL